MCSSWLIYLFCEHVLFIGSASAASGNDSSQLRLSCFCLNGYILSWLHPLDHHGLIQGWTSDPAGAKEPAVLPELTGLCLGIWLDLGHQVPPALGSEKAVSQSLRAGALRPTTLGLLVTTERRMWQGYPGEQRLGRERNPHGECVPALRSYSGPNMPGLGSMMHLNTLSLP